MPMSRLLIYMAGRVAQQKHPPRFVKRQSACTVNKLNYEMVLRMRLAWTSSDSGLQDPSPRRCITCGCTGPKVPCHKLTTSLCRLRLYMANSAMSEATSKNRLELRRRMGQRWTLDGHSMDTRWTLDGHYDGHYENAYISRRGPWSARSYIM